MWSSEVRGVVASTHDQGRHFEDRLRTSSLARSVLPHPTFLVGSSSSPSTARDTQSISSYLLMRSFRGRVSRTLFFFSCRNVLSLRSSVSILTSPNAPLLARSSKERLPRSGHRKTGTRTASGSSRSTDTNLITPICFYTLNSPTS